MPLPRRMKKEKVKKKSKKPKIPRLRKNSTGPRGAVGISHKRKRRALYASALVVVPQAKYAISEVPEGFASPNVAAVPAAATNRLLLACMQYVLAASSTTARASRTCSVADGAWTLIACADWAEDSLRLYYPSAHAEGATASSYRRDSMSLVTDSKPWHSASSVRPPRMWVMMNQSCFPRELPCAVALTRPALYVGVPQGPREKGGKEEDRSTKDPRVQ